MTTQRIQFGVIPRDLSEEVDRWVDSELAEAEKYDNRAPLDDSGVWSLHRLVESAYAAGFDSGASIAEQRARTAMRRWREAGRPDA